MAKKNQSIGILLQSSGSKFNYITKKNPRKKTEKLSFRKYDPILRKHVEFVEKKLPSGKK